MLTKQFLMIFFARILDIWANYEDFLVWLGYFNVHNNNFIT